MEVKRIKPKETFKPITITLETERELSEICNYLGRNNYNVNEVIEELFKKIKGV